MADEKADIDRIFHALGDGTRREMVERISLAPISVSSLAKPFGMSLAAVVQHLQILENSGLVRSEKVGRVRTYSIDSNGLTEVEAWIRERRSVWERSLDRLGEFLVEDQ
jgi:DNA-binding transcriptional ArsR family regulator